MTGSLPATRSRDGALALPRQRADVLRSPVVALTLIVGVSAAVRGFLGLAVDSPWILPDEVVYSELAKSIADGGRPSIRGVPVFGWGEVYPTLVAPAWALFEDPVLAYRAALFVNAIVMSLAAVPAYLLARLFVPRGLSLVVALMTVLVPSMAYTGVVMTENAFYPVFVLALWLLARVVSAPTIGNQALAIAGLGLVVFTRIQGAALLGAYAASVLLYAWTSAAGSRLGYLRRFLPTAALAVPIAVAPVVLSIVRGNGATGWLGTRSGTFDALHLHEVPHWTAFLVADLVIYLAAIPVLATVVVVGMGVRRTAPVGIRHFTAVALPVFAAMLLSIAFVSAGLDVDGTENLNERYVFYVVPLAFVGLALWVQAGLPRRHPWSATIVGICCLLAALLPIERLSYNASFQSVALVPWLSISVSGDALMALVALVVLGLGALWLIVRIDRTGRLWLVVGVWMTITAAFTVGSNHESAWNSAHAFHGRQPTWIDDAVPDGAQVDVLWRRGPERTATTHEFWIMVNEFFNHSVGTVYRIGRPTYYEGFLPTSRVRVRGDRSIVDGQGVRVDTDYVLVTCRTPVVGQTVAVGPERELMLIRVEKPLRLAGPNGCTNPRT